MTSPFPTVLGAHEGRKLQILEGAKGFAALYVVLHHAFPAGPGALPIVHLFRFGQEAVILFFLISGFVIHYSTKFGRGHSFGSYFWKRFLRIYVPLVPTLAISYGLLGMATGRYGGFDGWELAGNLLMLQDVSALKPGVIVDSWQGNTPLWSLSYEWWFYMMFYPLVRIPGPARTWILGGIVTASAITYGFYPAFPWRVLAYLGIWWAGVEMAEAYLGLRSFKLAARRAFAFILIPGFVMLIPIWSTYFSGNFSQLRIGVHPWLEFRHFASAAFLLLVALVWKSIGWKGSRQLVLPWAILAPVSYGIYILHTPLLIKASYLNGFVSKTWQFAIYSAVLILVSWSLELRLYPWVRNKFYSLRAVSIRS